MKTHLKRLLRGAAAAGIAAALLFSHKHVPVLEAQTFPLTVKVGIAPDTSANPPLGYTVTLDGGAAADVGLPSTVTCTTLSGGAQATCVPFAVSIPAAGSHTVSIVGYNIAGNSTPGAVTFIVTTAPPSAPSNVRIVR